MNKGNSAAKARSAGLSPVPEGVVCLADYERQARACLEHEVFEYFDSGSGDELSLARNRSSFAEYQILPRVLRRVTSATTALSILGQRFRHPILLGPVAHQRLVHDEAELAVADAAQAMEAGMVVSTLASVSLEEVASHGLTRRWFQLYFQPTRQATLSLLRRAETAGYQAIVLTVDAPVNGVRNRIQRAGFSVPEHARAVNLDGYSVPEPRVLSPDDSIVFQGLMSEAPDWADLEWLVSQTELPVIVKGIMDPRDAVQAAESGAQGVVVSNHGGRSLDAVPATIDVVQGVRNAVGGEFLVLLDGGVRRGTDVFIALACGANAVLLGRPQVHALAVAGAYGVAHMIKIMRDELEIAMALTGCSSIDEIARDAVVTRRS